ncbi:hypothetical protein [Pontibacter sp. G13]|uniref:hypothetical protein n=1 Tax=Pontibacter sp. G13 TaxID=3074898 RepID=UPI002889AB60|nr:hypothetical protein [Pontibacter sp. G13]WNJ21490.1 hypothetical protein RJD25_13555 [Pontibacter sp. G13]
MVKRNPWLKIATLVLCLITGFAMNGCQKYEEGPLISFRSKTQRVTNNWVATEIYRNDLDETLKYDLFSMVFTSGGEFTWTIQPSGGLPVSITADWELARLDQEIKLTLDEDNALERELLYLEIKRLTEDEMLIRYLIEGDYYDLVLKGA